MKGEMATELKQKEASMQQTIQSEIESFLESEMSAKVKTQKEKIQWMMQQEMKAKQQESLIKADYDLKFKNMQSKIALKDSQVETMKTSQKE